MLFRSESESIWQMPLFAHGEIENKVADLDTARKCHHAEARYTILQTFFQFENRGPS